MEIYQGAKVGSRPNEHFERDKANPGRNDFRHPFPYVYKFVFSSDSNQATMSAQKADKSAAQTPTPGSSSGGVDIPEAMDGFFGYSEEKSLKQVFGIVITLNHTSKLPH